VQVALNDGMSEADSGRPDGAAPSGVAPSGVKWPVLSGEMPPLAESYSSRPETGLGYITTLPPGETLVLTDQAGTRDPAGGTGKSQLAVAAARNLWQTRAVDLLAWVPGSSRDGILTGFVQALGAIGGHLATGEDSDRAAARVLAWLAEARRPWLVVVDDLAEPADLDGLWPRGKNGRVLLTTRLPADSLIEHRCRVVQVGTFSPRESVSYLAARLAGDPDQRTGVLDLATDLGGLPLALAQAASVMVDAGMGCRQYRDGYTERNLQMAVAGQHPATVAATWLLAFEHADKLAPAGLAWPVLVLVALLGPGGIPPAVLTGRAACDYVCGDARAADQVRGVLANLARVGLVTLGGDRDAPTVRMHALVQSEIRQVIPEAQLEQAARVAADALVQAWPQQNLPLATAQALRACTSALHHATGDLLWSPDGHPVLLLAGQSLDGARLAGPAVAYWRELADTSHRLLGPGHPSTLLASDKLAAALETVGRPEEAMVIYEQTLAERGRVLGWQHAETLTNRSRLAGTCLASGLYIEAVSLLENTLSGREWALGKAHADTLATRGDLARAYRAAGRPDDAVSAFAAAASAREATVGPSHPSTLAARAELASALQAAGRLKEAVTLQEETVRECERVLGANHEDTIAARASLANAYRSTGRMKDAQLIYKRTLAERERLLGPDHPDTLAARANLASSYHTARKYKEAISLYEQTLAGREKTQGDEHPDTLLARVNLAAAYHSAGRMVHSIPLYERALADYRQVYGPDHPDTLALRAELASAYQTVGRLTDAIASLEQTLADCERALPPDHPLTRSVRETLEAATG
jgi:tetratricopeptide (TPR) repeat protein